MAWGWLTPRGTVEAAYYWTVEEAREAMIERMGDGHDLDRLMHMGFRILRVRVTLVPVAVLEPTAASAMGGTNVG